MNVVKQSSSSSLSGAWPNLVPACLSFFLVFWLSSYFGGVSREFQINSKSQGVARKIEEVFRKN